MREPLKRFFYYCCKYCGLFILSRLLMKKKLRILCYHGFSLQDEELFVPGLFIRLAEFERRLEYLKQHNYQVITLDQAYCDYKQQSFPDDAVVLTIDDGFYSVYKLAAPLLHQYNYPATLYLTSYYFDRLEPIFTLTVDYMFWKTQCKQVSLDELHIVSLPTEKVPLTDDNKLKLREQLKQHGQSLPDAECRELLLQRLGECLNVDYGQLKSSRILGLINQQELKQLIALGVDIQLHTHRHELPVDSELARDALVRNKQKVNPLLATPMVHFCYPSGDWKPAHWPILQQQQVLTATTCTPRLVDYDTPHYSLDRILDSSRVSQIEFEAEVCGFNQLIRQLRGQG
ncbi:polysaccharide deacetylase family protein [Psychrobium sp. 1_MG-2023]|uniref:polysaccharide deacetylase family protein n=1 Tax=Psychrobium sp. 1_MG-2023 TaxID=3062624 RepID=UPI000C32E4D8|nr:polysaccharide deacetylase family protein [Psychrobium sp. 1_MG-2023]MDP2560851.1 polysaccharide deacetylase family protein [Psychrobium sp. 1_MG-2023]PKF56725.1 hypothetical protein CW748_09610 [Alteromonadales bacterium alter-6D02]